ncbi:hypothetical protein J6S35_00510 [Candidatus Saccharibacteria bacterium]|nr:hypothetical protein [Candidatus Saccharibacteria bacterium]
MDETVNEQLVFEESDFATDQTPEVGSPAVEDSNEQPTNINESSESKEDSTNQNANESQTGDEEEEVFDFDKFMENKHIKSDDPDVLRKVAEMYWNVEKGFSRKSQENAQLERRLERMNAQQAPTKPTNDPMERIQNLERQLAADRQLTAVKEWKAAKNPSPEVEAKMIEYLERPLVSNGVPQTDAQGRPLTNNFLVNMGALTYDDVFRLVGGDSFKADAVKQELKTAVANEIAAKQSAKSPNALATNSTQFAQPKTADDEFVSGLFGD